MSALAQYRLSNSSIVTVASALRAARSGGAVVSVLARAAGLTHGEGSGRCEAWRGGRGERAAAAGAGGPLPPARVRAGGVGRGAGRPAAYHVHLPRWSCAL